MPTLDELRCSDCGDGKIIAIWPGSEGEQGDLFRLTPYRLVRCWCEMCWLKRYGAHPRLPRRGSKAKTVQLAQD